MDRRFLLGGDDKLDVCMEANAASQFMPTIGKTPSDVSVSGVNSSSAWGLIAIASSGRVSKVGDDVGFHSDASMFIPPNEGTKASAFGVSFVVMERMVSYATYLKLI